ncbi:MAG: hypothetical protein DI598_15160 [Pseudopedobacter saltans]|uniref:Uncharacterized protein n=1 Tax=Pseudopedobacter saltans TaxID=151895 RepID=A0A2W5GKU7_9SPHI|nr:MAG: hypothetical protein DI598_15160 [Pseudopedobacter saltans]
MKLKLLIFTLFISAIIIRFFCGIYVHDEFAETNFFIKYKPTWKWKFYSPRGMSDLKFEEMSAEQKTEQKYWEEFIVGRQPL